MVMHLLRWTVLIVALSPFAYYVLATYCGWEYFRKLRKLPPLDPSFAPPASILKPVRGLDREAYENFASFCRMDYPEFEILFAVSDPDDPVIPVIEKLQRDFPNCAIRLLVGVAELGSNRKVNNLCKLAQEAKYDLLVMNDSDVRVERDYLWEVVTPFANPDVGAVTAFFRGMTEGSTAAELEGLVLSTETVPSALVARRLEGKIQFAFGWTMATTKQHLAAIGGFEAMVNHHSDDFELGNRIAAHRFRIELMRKPVWVVFPRETLGEYLRHEMRWSIGLRNVRPAGYVGLGLTFGLPWAVLAAAVAPAKWIGAGYLVAYVVLRLVQAWTVGVWGLHDPVTRKSLWLVPLRDAVNFVVWLAGFFSSKIRWRGLEFRVKERLLVPIRDAKGARSGTRCEAQAALK